MLWLVARSHRYILFLAFGGAVNDPSTVGGRLSTVSVPLSTAGGPVVHVSLRVVHGP
jgi:hypothetical protein